MLNKIIVFSVRNKLIIGLMVIALIAVGAYQATRLPIDAVPDITDNQVQVITLAPSYGATDIERLVTFPIEQANSNIAGIKEIRSFSRFGLSLVTIVFEDQIDIYWARQQVAERLQQIGSQIPPEIGQPELGPISTGLGEIYQYVVRVEKGYEKEFDVTELRSIQDWIIRRQLIGLKGVAEVSSFGGKLKQYEVAVRPDVLKAHQLAITDVFEALASNNQNTGGSYIEKGATVLYVRSEGLLKGIDDIRQIPITSKSSSVPLLIGDVADVRIGYATRYGAMTYNGEGEVAGAVVMMLKGANSNTVIKDVKARIEQIQKTLPQGVLIEPFLDRTKMVNNAISTVKTNLMEGALIVVFVLVVFLGNLRAGLLVASVIPLALLFAICMMNLFGVGGNLMSLGALDFGLIIDGAVIIVEAVMHQMVRSIGVAPLSNANRRWMEDTVIASASKMMNSAVFGQVIILIVYLPILTLEGIEGKMFKPMAQTVAFALLGAFLLSLTYVPMMSALVLKRAHHTKKNISDRMMDFVSQSYQGYLLKALRIPGIILGIVSILFISSIWILSRMGGEFIPSLEEGDFAVDTRVLTGSNLTTTINSTQQAAQILKSRFPEVIKVVTKIGSGEVPTDPMPMEASDMMVILKDKKEWTTAKTFPELADTMSKALQDVPGITAGFQYPVQMRFNELMTGARQDVVLKIFGDDLTVLASKAEEVGKIIAQVEGTKDLYIEPITGLPQVVINYNRSRMSQYRISIAAVNRIVNAAMAGEHAGQIYEGEARYDLVVRMDQAARKDINDLRNILIPLPTGDQVPLSHLAEVRIQDGPNQIQRENAQRRIVVGFNIKDRDVQSIVDELQGKIDRAIRLPAGYSITYGGSFENLNMAKDRLMVAVPIALLLIFLLLYFAFRSIKESFLIYSAIPLSIIGGVFLLALRGMPFSISAGVGFIALFGVAVLNGIVLISEFNRLKKEGWKNIYRVVLYGTQSRLRPVMMTAFVASLGFIPMAVSNGAGAEVQRPLATVVIGGLMFATFLTLFVLPIFYIIMEKKSLHNTKATSVLLSVVLLLVAPICYAQQPISLEKATQIALANNRSIKTEQLRAAYAKAMIGTSVDIPQTALAAGYGQINDRRQDNMFTINQEIALPLVYSRKEALLESQWKLAQLQTDMRAYDLQREVALAYYEVLYWEEKYELMRHTDSLYRDFVQKATLRFEKGLTNAVEKLIAKNQQQQIAVQLAQLEQQKQITLLTFRWLLNTDVTYVPVGKIAALAISIEQQPNIAEYPQLQLIKQLQEVMAKEIRSEQGKLYPGLLFVYNNNSFKSTIVSEQLAAGKRFHSFQIGISLPIFTRAQKAKIRAFKVKAEEMQNTMDFTLEKVSYTRETLLMQYHNEKQILKGYEATRLSDAKEISHLAQRQFVAGAIDYMEYVFLINQSITVYNDYVDSLRKLNQYVVMLKYLSLTQ